MSECILLLGTQTSAAHLTKRHPIGLEVPGARRELIWNGPRLVGVTARRASDGGRPDRDPKASAPSDPGDSQGSGSRLVPAVVCGLEGLALLGFCAFYLYELVLGEGDDATRVVMSIALMALVAVALLVMARAWLRGLVWPRTPTILWNLLLLPVAWSMKDAGFWGAWPLGLVAVVGVLAAWRSSRGDAGDAVI